MSELTAVLDEVRSSIRPDVEERERLREVADELADRARAAIAELPVEADVIQVGSTARGTWLAGDRDIDLFVRFPPDLPRSRLREYGLAVGHHVLPDGHEEYAEHPYVKGEYAGFDVDCVPCYDVADATAIKSAVDRTPYHNEYLQERLDEALMDDVRLAKGFLKGIGAYGSNLKTQGFSGYLTELLVCEYGGFVPLIEAAADWSPPMTIDPENHAAATFDDPLVVIDPTDPERNVAAVLSAENVARFQHYARELLAAASEELFTPREPEPLTAAAVREELARRGTEPVAIVFDAPDLVDDQLWPQLRKSLSGVRRELVSRGYEPLRSRAMIEGGTEPDGAGEDVVRSGRAVLFLELSIAELPAIERHRGPPVAVRGHAEGFYEAYADDDDPRTYGPYLDGDRYVVEREREFTSAAAFLGSDALFDVALGTHVEDVLADRKVLVDDEVATLADGFGRQFADYFDPRP